DLNSGQYFGLNETATAIWKLILSNKSLPEITDEIFKRFQTDSTDLDKDIQETVDDLIAKGLVSEKEDVSPSEIVGEEISPADSTRMPYTKPEVEEHAPIKQVTAGTYTSCGGGHYWYPC
ncbi:unnamed protein product, partial [marine sediment metagenome]